MQILCRWKGWYLPAMKKQKKTVTSGGGGVYGYLVQNT